jgi:hypothetical protein
MARCSILSQERFHQGVNADKDAGVYPDYLFIKPRSQHKGGFWSRAIRAPCYKDVAKRVISPEKMMILRGNINATGID